MKRVLFCCVFLAFFTLLTHSQALNNNKDAVVSSSKQFIENLNSKPELSYEMFDNETKKQLSAEVLKSIWDACLKKYGKFIGFSEYGFPKKNTFSVITLKLEFENAFLTTVFEYTNNQISTFRFVAEDSKEAKKEYVYPKYSDTNRFIAKETKVVNGEYSLAAELLIPKGEGTFPAIILVHGSGPNDLDETIGPNKPFKDIATGLASNGIAVLRYDKRTKAYPIATGNDANFTVFDETVDDVFAAYNLLIKEAKINSKRIFVLGHSLGGYLIPRIAEKNKNYAGFIVLAGNNRPLQELIIEQYTYIFNLDGKINTEEENNLKEIKAELDKINYINDKGADTLHSIFNNSVSYWRDLKKYKPLDLVKKIEQPILFLQGERDYQVTIKDFNNWKNTLSNKTNVDFKLYPNLNHLFFDGQGMAKPAEYGIKGIVEPVVINDIINWILKID